MIEIKKRWKQVKPLHLNIFLFSLTKILVKDFITRIQNSHNDYEKRWSVNLFWLHNDYNFYFLFREYLLRIFRDFGMLSWVILFNTIHVENTRCLDKVDIWRYLGNCSSQYCRKKYLEVIRPQEYNGNYFQYSGSLDRNTISQCILYLFISVLNWHIKRCSYRRCRSNENDSKHDKCSSLLLLFLFIVFC